MNIYLHGLPSPSRQRDDIKSTNYNREFLSKLFSSLPDFSNLFLRSGLDSAEIVADISSSIKCLDFHYYFDNLSRHFLYYTDKTFPFEFAARDIEVASAVCKSTELRLRISSEGDRYLRIPNTATLYNLIFCCSSIYSSIIRSNNLDVAVFYETPHALFDTLLSETFIASNRKVVVLTRTLFDDLLLDRQAFKSRPSDFHCAIASTVVNRYLAESDMLSHEPLNRKFLSYWNRFTQAKPSPPSHAWSSNLFIPVVNFFKLFIVFFSSFRDAFTRLFSSIDRRSTHEILMKRRSFYDVLYLALNNLFYISSLCERKLQYSRLSRSSSEIFDKYKVEKFVYFPLPVEPERTTVPEGGSTWYHLFSTISSIRSCLPDHISLLIKEHPNMFVQRQAVSGYRNNVFYSMIAALPRTYLVSETESSATLSALSSCVVLHTGSTGFEAFLLGKPVVVLGEPWYQSISGIFTVTNVTQLSSALTRALDSPDISLILIKKRLKEFLSSEPFIFGATPIAMREIIYSSPAEVVFNHARKSALSLSSYLNNLFA